MGLSVLAKIMLGIGKKSRKRSGVKCTTYFVPLVDLHGTTFQRFLKQRMKFEMSSSR